MHEHDLEERLADEASIPGLDAGLRARLLDATTAHIRGRRRRSQLARVAAVALAFASGMAVMAGLRNTPGPATTASSASDPPAVSQQAGGETEHFDGFEVTLFDDPEALAFAYDAADAPGRLRLVKAAGDYELNVRGDVRAALDYYRQWVRIADETTRTKYDESDTWLLASLKHTP
jgi:hypothetical protein